VTRRLLCAHWLKWRLAALRVVLRVALFTPDLSHQKCVPYATQRPFPDFGTSVESWCRSKITLELTKQMARSFQSPIATV